MLFHLALEFWCWHLLGFVQPDCTIELLPLPTRDLRQIRCLCPTHLSQLTANLPRQLLMNRHQVVGLAARLRKFPRQELIEGLQIVDPPVLPGPRFAEITSEFHKAGIALLLRSSFPGQDLVDLGENKHSPTTIQFWRHERVSVTPQTGQANQGLLLQVGE